MNASPFRITCADLERGNEKQAPGHHQSQACSEAGGGSADIADTFHRYTLT